jgi:DNA-binding MarR family transcriptional regulator
MQLLSHATKEQALGECAHAVVNSVPPVIWFIRAAIKKHRGRLSFPQFRVLCKVNRQPAVSLSELAEHLGSSLPTASRMVTGMVNKGLLVRKGCENDRRQLQLGLTEAGRRMLESVWGCTHEEIARPLGKLSREEREVVMRAMGILRGLFGSAGVPEALERSQEPEAGSQNTEEIVKSSNR